MGGNETWHEHEMYPMPHKSEMPSCHPLPARIFLNRRIVLGASSAVQSMWRFRCDLAVLGVPCPRGETKEERNQHTKVERQGGLDTVERDELRHREWSLQYHDRGSDYPAVNI